MEGTKNDNNKPSMELIEPSFLVGLAKVLDFGKEKYGRNNWRGGFTYSRLISAAYRHLAEIHSGKDLDSESNLPHIYHLAATTMFLAWMMENRKDLDDRYLPEKKDSLQAIKERNYSVILDNYYKNEVMPAVGPITYLSQGSK